jgi:hypothetical protein
MQRVVALTLALIFSFAAVAKADPVVTLGNYFMASNGNIGIPVLAFNDSTTGPNGSVQGLDLRVAIHDLTGNVDPTSPQFIPGALAQGNPTNTAYVGGVGTNQVVAGVGVGGDELTGTIFAPTTHTTPADNSQSNGHDLNIGLGIVTGSAALSNNPLSPSTIATLWIKGNGAPAGSHWSLTIGGLNLADQNGPDNGALDFGDGGAFNTVLIDGTITITPEPSSIVLGLLAAAGLAATIIRRKRSA